jgi:ATP-dependent Lon protease
VQTLILPKENQKDMVEIPEEIKKKIKFLFVKTMDQVLKLALSVEVKPKAKEEKAKNKRRISPKR